jgi:hypothetical protein
LSKVSRGSILHQSAFSESSGFSDGGIPTAVQVIRGQSLELILGSKGDRGPLLLRSLLGFFGVVFLFLAIDGFSFSWAGELIQLKGLSLAEASSLNRTSPSLF